MNTENIPPVDGTEIESVKEDESYKEKIWKEEHEKILIDWADKAMCYRWLHSRSNHSYSLLNTWFTIPVIVISTITGTANFAQDRFPVEYKDMAVMIIGSMNIITGVITTVKQFLKISELNEAHRVSSIAWDKFYRNIKIELAKSPEERIMVGQMIKMCKEEYDRLMETSPDIDLKVIQKFKNTFKNNPAFQKVIKPEICDQLTSTLECVYIKKEITELKLDDDKHNIYKLKLDNFRKSFYDVRGREPTQEEIVDNLKDEVNEDDIKILIKN